MFQTTDEQKELIDGAREAADTYLAATAKEDDEQEIFRPEYMKALGEAGLCGVQTSEQYDGLGLGYLEYAMVLEEIAKVSASYAVSVAVTGLPQVILQEYGTDEQKITVDAWFGAGRAIGCVCVKRTRSPDLMRVLSEPLL